MPDAISALAPLRWRGLTAPCESASYEHANTLPVREYAYVEGDGHDSTGRRSVRISCVLHFVNGLFDKVQWYPGEWHTWRAAMFDGTVGELEHPDLGRFNARCDTSSVRLTAQNRGGVVVEVVFVESLPDPESRTEFATASVDVGLAAAAADQAVEDAAVEYPADMDAAGLGSFVDAWESIKGEVFSATLRITGAINQVQGFVISMMDDLDAAQDPANNPLSVILVSFWSALEAIKKQAEKKLERATAKIVLTSDASMDGIATLTGNTVDDIISLNLALVRFSKVPKGTTVTYYTGGVALVSPF